MRRCALCGKDLAGMRAHARVCSAACRAEHSRVRRLLLGQTVDGYESLADRMAVVRKRTRRA